MTVYYVYQNNIEYGLIEADSEQEAIDKACQMAGFDNEADLLYHYKWECSDIVAEERYL